MPEKRYKIYLLTGLAVSKNAMVKVKNKIGYPTTFSKESNKSKNPIFPSSFVILENKITILPPLKLLHKKLLIEK